MMIQIINKISILIILIVILLSQITAETPEVKITGYVRDNHLAPLAYVNIFFTDGIEGGMSDESGYFELHSKRFGQRIIRISHIGYEQLEIPLLLERNKPIALAIELKKTFVKLDAVTVSASSFTATDGEGHTLNRLDVVTTAGAAADVFRVILTLPGVNTVDEGAGMFVRGGDVSENLIILDGATLAHPYRYESDQGGYFGMISPFLLSGTYFSSGAFSAKYGNALSAVLAMETLGMPEQPSTDIGVGLAAVSFGGNYPLKPNRLGLRFSGNYSNTTPLFQLNGGTDKFDKFPVSWDANISLTYRPDARTNLKLFNYFARENLGVYYNSPTFSGNLSSGNDQWLTNLVVNRMIGERTSLRSSLSINYYRQKLLLGNLIIDNSERLNKLRSDLSMTISRRMKINTGLEIILSELENAGTYPEDANDLRPEAPAIRYDNNYFQIQTGLYIESEWDISARLFTITGLRTDNQDFKSDPIIDPRFSLGYRLTETQIVKFATGRFHQFNQGRVVDPNYGNPALPSMQAVHYVAGYELKSGLTNLRIESYYKEYSRLPLDSLMAGDERYTGKGHGFAYGADFFLKANYNLISGWTSYSYLVSKRKTLNYPELVATDYDIRHNFTIALKVNIMTNNSIGFTYHYTSGKPYTPGLGRWNAERLPAIRRLDLSYSYYTYIHESNFLVFYAAIANLLDRRNIYGYYYSPDFSQRTELRSTYGRNLYFGISLSIK